MENYNSIHEQENPLFKRKEVQFTIDAEVTPSNAEVGKFISEKFSAPIDAIKIKNILGKFGLKSFTISANIYPSKEDKESIERKQKKDDVLKPEEPVIEQPEETSEASTESKEEVQAEEEEAKE